MAKNKLISIIIVNYHVKKELLNCIDSIYSSRIKVSFEIIVVDNDKQNLLGRSLLERFPKVKYIKSPVNLGFGAGNNLGAKYARGEYLLFLNPDTTIVGNAIDNLFNFIDKNKKAGIVSPLILDRNKKMLDRQGYKDLNLLNGIFTFSFLRKWFPQLSISSFYSSDDWRKESIKKVDTVYGAALMIPRKIFNKVKGFDEGFFLYFEEYDLSKRVRELGYELFINANAKIVHKIGQSIKQIKNNEYYFEKGRFLYFRKYYGIFWALLFESFLKINKKFIFISIILLIALVIRTYNLSQSMVFIGDQGWFYLSARDLLVHGQIPLVGITSSHTWLHQGPLWTYMLSIVLFISNFNPVSGAYLTAIFGVATVFLIYKLGSIMFSAKAGFIAAALYATSPLIIFFDRMPFDPSPIPFFVVLYFFALVKWIQGNIKYFPFIILFLVILYNLELATFTLFFPFALFLIAGFIKKRQWVKKLLNKKMFFASLVAFLVPMVPVILYDFSHGFKQTVIFFGWTFYKPFSILLKNSSGNFLAGFDSVVKFLLENLSRIIFQFNLEVAVAIFILSLIYLLYVNFKKIKFESSKFILLFLLLVSLSGIVINQTPSDAYLPLTFPFIIFTIAIMFDYFLSLKLIRYATIILLALIILTNTYFSFLITQKNEFKVRTAAVDQIIRLTEEQEYNLVGTGLGSQFKSFTMNYEYLLWWKGHPPSNRSEKVKVIVSEDNKGIHISLR